MLMTTEVIKDIDMAMEKNVDDLAGNNLERWGVETPVLSLALIKEVCVSGIFLNRNSFRSTKEIQIRLKGCFQKEFLYNLGGGAYVPPTTLRVHQIIRRADNRVVLREMSPELAVISPAHFLGYIQMLAELFVCIPYGKFDIIAFSIGSVRRTVLIMRARFVEGGFDVFVEDVYRFNEWAPGTQIISRRQKFGRLKRRM